MLIKIIIKFTVKPLYIATNPVISEFSDRIALNIYNDLVRLGGT